MKLFRFQLYDKCLSVAIVGIMLLFLSGCAYPKELRKENQINPGEFITLVQQAVDQFHEKSGVLPIKNSTMDTPLYEKYVVDFGKLQKMHLLSSVPANAFESGGIFMYVLVDVETKPQVKLMDLLAYQSFVDVQRKVDDYKAKHGGDLPKGFAINEAFNYVDFDKLSMKSPEIKSAFNRNHSITFMIHSSSGQVAIDYGMDIMKLIQSESLQSSLEPDQDLRDLLIANSYFVPIRSYAYYWQNDQPMPQNKE